MKIKVSQILQTSVFLVGTLFFAGCSNEENVLNGEQTNDDNHHAKITFSGQSASDIMTRTSLADHTKGSNAKVLWESGDHIWVKDDGGVYQNSSTLTSSNMEIALFDLNNGTFTGANHSVVYTGKNSTSATEVEIKAEQTQTGINSFAHLGASGDCGTALAVKQPNGIYRFTLEHKASYLCIYPRIEYHKLRKNVKINKIVITSTSDPIAGKYDFTGGTLSSTPTSAASNTITLNTSSGELSSKTSSDTCYYAVIAPGTHTLKLEYFIQDPSTNVSKRIIKQLGSVTCNEGKATEITAWVDKELIEYNSFYMWDAEKPYWYGYENVQPLTNGASNPNYPKSGDARFRNPDPTHKDVGTHNPLFMSSSAKHIPTVNEVTWYLLRGDLRWDTNGVYVFNGHLQQGDGVWMKKMSVIISENAADVAAAGGDVRRMGLSKYGSPFHDYRNAGYYVWFTSVPSSTPLVGDEEVDYFFLPLCIGTYNNGTYQTFASYPLLEGSGAGYYLYKDFGGLTIYYGSSFGGHDVGFPAVPFL